MGYLVAVKLVAIYLPAFIHNFSINFNLASTFMHHTTIIFSLYSIQCIHLITGFYISVSFHHIFDWKNHCLFYSLAKVVSQKCHKLTEGISSLRLGNGLQSAPTNPLQALLQMQRTGGMTAFQRRAKQPFQN